MVAQQAQTGQGGPGQRSGQHRAHEIVLAFQAGPDRAQAGPSGGDQPLPQQGGFDIRTFAVKAKPVNEVANIRPGMSVIVDWSEIEKQE